MRFTTFLLPAIVCSAGFVSAQAPSPNAIGLWRSDDATKSLGLGLGVTAGQTGFSIWSILPPDVLTYFRSQTAGGQRELDFRGIQFFVNVPTAGVGKQQTIPKIEIRRANPAAAPNEGRWLPATTPAGLLVTFNNVNLGTPTGAFQYVIYYEMPFAVTFPTGNPTSAVVPAGGTTGAGLAVRVVDYQSQYGTAGGSLYFACSTNESPWMAGSGPLSGITTGGANPQNLWLDQVSIGTPAVPMSTHEWMFTWFFDQSMIAPLKNPTRMQSGATFSTGGVLPASLDPLNGGFAIQADDGRGALAPVPGDVVSWSINSNVGAKLGPTGAGQVWCVPFMLFEGDVVPGDPTPENWVGNNAAAQLSYVYKMPLQKWFDDVEVLFGNPTPTLGGLINPNNSTLGLWLGADLTNGFLNITALLNGFTLSDIGSGPAFAGPETKMYNSTNNATGVMARNPAKFGTLTAEFKTLQATQWGYTPVVASQLVPTMVGLDYPVIVPNPVQGKGFYITCWLLDVASPTNPFSFNILDMSSVLKFTLQ